MPDLIIRILSIIGIVLFILLCMVLLLLLLVLFWPVTYRLKGEKDSEKLFITAKADWLFGLLRVRYAYPEPGKVVVKLLWKTLMDTGAPKEDRKSGGQEKKNGEDSGTAGKDAEAGSPVQTDAPIHTENGESGKDTEKAKKTAAEASGDSTVKTESQTDEPEPNETEPNESKSDEPEPNEPSAEDVPEKEQVAPSSHIFEKIQKIKYTILNIYDKIKEIWANITYYIDFLREEDTALLWGHVKLRLGKILKNIRPRHIRANVLFGTGAPDTTGYVFGIYCMLLPVLGKKVCLTPDFNQAILEGNIDVSGHITLCTLIWNALKLLLDKKLKLFIKKMKAGRKENGR